MNHTNFYDAAMNCDQIIKLYGAITIYSKPRKTPDIGLYLLKNSFYTMIRNNYVQIIESSKLIMVFRGDLFTPTK